MRKIIVLLISVVFLASCGRKPEETVVNHYQKAKEYYNRRGLIQSDKELLELYIKILDELELALFETSGEAREEVVYMMDECKYNMDFIKQRLESRETYYTGDYETQYDGRHEQKSVWTKEKMREVGESGIGSDLNDAIEKSRREIERKRYEYK